MRIAPLSRRLIATFVTLTASVACVAAASAWSGARARAPQAAPPTANVEAFAAWKTAGAAAPMTVYPAQLAGKPSPQVGMVVALFLERAGMTNLATSTEAFAPAPNTDGAGAGAALDLGAEATAFAAFVKQHPPATEYAPLADFRGTPGVGVSEVRGIVANRDGQVVWARAYAKGDAAFDRAKPREPMECCLLLASELRPVLGLADPARANAPEGPIARAMRKESGLPSDAEQRAMDDRARALASAGTGASLVVMPVRSGGAPHAEDARVIATRVTELKLASATAADRGPTIQVTPSINEQQVLWQMARGLAAEVRAHPVDADYALYAEYMLGTDAAGKPFVGAVHFAVVNRAGELVLVDFQNDHSPAFRSARPATREACDALVAQRLKERLTSIRNQGGA